MPRTRQFNPLLLSARNGDLFPLIFLLLSLAAVAVSGQEAIPLQPMPGNGSGTWTLAFSQGADSAALFGFLQAPRLEPQVTDVQDFAVISSTFSSNSLTGGTNGFLQHDWVQWDRKSEATGIWAHLEAGYGQFCQAEPVLGKSVMEREQPGCAYLKARFSF